MHIHRMQSGACLRAIWEPGVIRHKTCITSLQLPLDVGQASVFADRSCFPIFLLVETGLIWKEDSFAKNLNVFRSCDLTLIKTALAGCSLGVLGPVGTPT